MDITRAFSFSGGTLETLLEEVKIAHIEVLNMPRLGFPKCSEFSARIISGYLANRIPGVQLVRGTFKGNAHWWSKINGQIVDFTAFQYLLNNGQVNYSLPSYNIYTLCVLCIQGGHVVDSPLTKFYVEEEVVNQFDTCDKDSSYLSFAIEKYYKQTQQ